MQTKRTIVVGCGAVLEYIHRNTLAMLQEQALHSVTALVDTDPTTLSKALDWFPRARGYESLTQALEVDSFDCAFILTPPRFHVEAILACLERDIAVFCEKPLSVSAAEALPLLNHRNVDLVRVGMIRRYYPAFAFLRQHLGDLVDLETARFTWFEGSRYSWPISSDHAFRHASGGAGVVLDIGVHVVDALSWIFGGLDSVTVETDSTDVFVEANANLECRIGSATGRVKLSWTDTLPYGFSIYSARGEIWAGIHGQPTMFRRPHSKAQWAQVKTRTRKPGLLRVEPSASRYEVDDFLAGRSGALSNVREAVAVLQHLGK